MNTQFSRKLLQHLFKNNDHDGFTWWEVLVVTIIIGILSVLALPSFLNQPGRAVSSESRLYTGSLNRSQQAYFLENGRFSKTISKLDLGSLEQTMNNSINYNYSTIATSKAAFNYGIARHEYAQHHHNSWFNSHYTSSSTLLITVVGAVFVVPVKENNKIKLTTIAVLCESKFFTATRPANPILKNGVPVCPEGTREIE
ncbi:type IV pilin-like G/H family protein [Anabaena catenula]|uniref:Prepilin-type N-terminal cleavage/methylation domain-containing protein n=1 Tax=Anabaena catenula FACHB-362 TaxID=2692877 RepID=A0ABR8J2Z0_9NOST|nr:type IV pilin-like G/H family protein [Anabaena catenula]MBD2692023.1 prepilin-type N-terminal cleavage/methylation domain-containing protein [Anabaena catenula FACHB-362]